MRHGIGFWATALTLLSCCWSELAHAQDSGILYGVRAVNGQLVARSLDLSSSQPLQERGKLALPPEERLDAVFQDRDRSIGVIRTSIKPRANRRALIRRIGIPEHLIDVSAGDIAGLSASYGISSILVPQSGAPLALVAHYTDTLPFWLANVDLSSGRVTILDMSLDPKTRYSHLTQCPDGKIYAVSLAPQWNIRIVRLDLEAHAVDQLPALRVNGNPSRLSVRDLACGPAGQLYALSDIDRSGIRSLYRVDIATGTMTWVTAFDVDRMIFVR